MNFDPRRGLEPYRTWLEATRSWSDGALGSQRVLARAVRRSAEETRAVLAAAHAVGGTPDLANLARLTDLSRARWFLWAGAGLTAAEISGRGIGAFSGAFPAAYSPRALVLATVAADLCSGYAALRERSRWFPGLAAEEDWGLQHRRGATRVLDTAEALGGVLIKAGQFASTSPDLLPPPTPRRWPRSRNASRRNRTRPSARPWPASWAARRRLLLFRPGAGGRGLHSPGAPRAVARRQGGGPSRSSTPASSASSRQTSTHWKPSSIPLRASSQASGCGRSRIT